MAQRRGLSNQDRLGVNAIAVTAAGFVKNAPLYLYSLCISKRNATASALVILADTTASADTVTDAIWSVTLPATTNATGGGETNYNMSWMPPIYIQKGLDADITNTADISVSYLDAS